MIEAAMQRTYAGNTGEAFFTGGGLHVFHNFERYEDFQSYTVEEAFKHSVNLCFVRILRDVADHYAKGDEITKTLLSDPSNPKRAEYLRRFADQEGRRFLTRYYDDFKGMTPDESLAALAGRTLPIARRLAVIFRSIRPDAPVSPP